MQYFFYIINLFLYRKSKLKMEEEKINKLIGMKILSFRKNNGLTRVKLAQSLNMTHQQLDKYEKGINKISAAKLAIIAEKLNININYFYENLSLLQDNKHQQEKEKIDILLKHYFNIKKLQNRELIINLAKELSKVK